jgi:glucose-6-phosphate isomerase
VTWEALTKGASCQTVTFEDLKEVLWDSDCGRRTGLDHAPVYVVYQDCGEGKNKRLLQEYGLRYDITVVSPLLLGAEYAKTMGHYNSQEEKNSYAEIVEILEGKAQLLVQKQRGEEVENVSLLIAEEGEKVLIPPDRGLVLINATSKRLTVGSLVSRSSVEVSAQYLRKRGAAVYVLTNDRIVHNLRYPWVPEFRILKARTPPFLGHDSPLMEQFVGDPGRFEVLKESCGPVGWLTFDWLKPYVGSH